MACVWKHQSLKSPFWIGQYSGPDGRRLNRSTKQTDRRKAQKVADTWEAAAKKARMCELTQAASIKILSELMESTTGEVLKVLSISEFLGAWISDRSQLGRATSTADRYQGLVKSLLSHLGAQRSEASIASLTTGEIEKWRNAQLAAGKGATTADYGVKVISAGLNSARRKGLILSNPAEAVEAVGTAAESREPFTDEELTSLLRAADEEWKGMILSGSWCGLRIADAANLTWGCIDLEKDTLTFQPSKTRNKDASPLTIALHQELVDYFSGLNRGIGKAPLFPSLYGHKSGSHGGLSNEFSRLMAKSGVIVRKGRKKEGAGRQFNSKGFHSLRHTMISRMANANVSPDVRRAMAGHSSDAVHRKYIHLSLDAQRSALKKLTPKPAKRKAAIEA